MLDIEEILEPTRSAASKASGPAPGREIGRSRAGRPILGYRFGSGALHVSLIGGCHADEPVGPAMLDRLVAHLASMTDTEPLLKTFSWWIVPHANPDGQAANRAWTDRLPDVAGWSLKVVTMDDGDQEELPAADLATYLRYVVREVPGEDMEFGFPRDGTDRQARPENWAIANFLSAAEEISLHGSFHGMGFAAGPWFLIEKAWADRTQSMRDHLRRIVEERGYRVHDIDRKGDKGFFRIDRGFTSRPDSRAMIQHFETQGDPETAALFRPSSMEWVRARGGDPLTLVSEMPLFLLPAAAYETGDPIRPPMLGRIREAFSEGEEVLNRTCEQLGVRAMPFRDQMYFQLAFLDQALRTVVAEANGEQRP